MEQYYNTLQLSPNCSVDEVKKKYRELSKVYHPDKNNGQDAKMKEIVDAYNKILAHLEKEDDSDVNIPAEMTLKEVCTGKTVTHSFTRIVKCSTCQDVPCVKCNGSGMIITTLNMGFLVMNQQSTCTTCNGGKMSRCLCKKKEHVNLTMNIPKGCFDNMRLQTQEKGNYIGNGNYKAVCFNIKVIPFNSFIREGNNLKTFLHINLKESLCGFDKVVTHPYFGDIKVTTDTISKNNDVIVMSKKGLPFFNGNEWGEMYVVVTVDYPAKLTDHQRKIIGEILY